MLKKKYLILAAALLSLAACEKQPGGQGEPIPMAVEVALDGTKAGVTVDDLADFYLQVNCPSDAAYSYFVHVTKATDGSWQTDKPMFWRDETTPVTYCAAWSPSHVFTQDEFTNGIDLSVPAAQTDATVFSANDQLLVKPTTTKYTDTPGGKLTIDLTHALSILRFELTLGEKFYDRAIGLTDNPVTNLSLGSMPLTYHFTASAGTVTPVTGSEADITPYASAYTPGTATAKAAKAVYEALVVPGTYEAGALTLNFKIGNGNYTWTNNQPVVLASGQSATLPVSVSTAPPIWILNGHDYVEMGDGLKWATCNIGAEYPWDYGDYYSWGATTTQTSYDWANYPFMKAGYSIETHITKYTVDDGRDAIWYDINEDFIGDGKTTFADYDYVDDAARQLWGGTWRVPTAEEWAALCNTTYYSWEWKTNYSDSGKNGMLVTRRPNTGPCSGNSIFLPAAGRWDDSNLKFVGVFGGYWSSTISTNHFSYYALHLYFTHNSMSCEDEYRFNGHPLRPVAD